MQYNLRLYPLLSSFLFIFALIVLLNSCSSEPKVNTDGNPVLSGNDRLIPTSPLEEPVKDTATLHEIKMMAEAIRQQNQQKANQPITQPITPPPSQPTYNPPPPLPSPAPRPFDLSGVTKVVEALQNIEQLDQRADAAIQAASKAEQRVKSAQQAINLAENQAAEKQCPELANIKKEADKVSRVSDNVEVRASNARKSAERVGSSVGDVRQKLSQINANLSRGADANSTLNMAQTAQATYTKVLSELSKSEKDAEAAVAEAAAAETAAYNAKNMVADCKTPKAITKAEPTTSVSINKNKIKTNLEQNLMDLSRNPRNVRIISDIKDNFGNFSQKGVISTDKGNYSVEQYITKLNLSGAMDVQITDISIDSEGKVTHAQIEETKLGK